MFNIEHIVRHIGQNANAEEYLMSKHNGKTADTASVHNGPVIDFGGLPKPMTG
jgi:hypothetical protein